MPQSIMNGRASAPSGMGARSPPGHHPGHAAIFAEATGAQRPVEALGGGAHAMVEVVIRGRGRTVTEQGPPRTKDHHRKPLYFDGYDNSVHVLGKARTSARV